MKCCVDPRAARAALLLLLLLPSAPAWAAPKEREVDLTLSLTTAGPFAVDQVAPLELWVQNLGPGPENQTIRVSAELPAGLELAASAAPWSADLSDLPRVTWSCDTTLAPGRGVALALQLVPRAAAVPGVTLVLTVQAGSRDTAADNDVLAVPVDLSGAAASALTALSGVQVLSDPINGVVHPKAIPGAVMLCTLQTANHGAAGDDGSLAVVHPVPVGAMLMVEAAADGAAPVVFLDGVPSSGLSVVFRRLRSQRDDVQFSADGGLSFDYVPVPDVLGCDAAVTHLRVTPRGVFNGLGAAGAPSFTLRCRVMVR